MRKRRRKRIRKKRINFILPLIFYGLVFLGVFFLYSPKNNTEIKEQEENTPLSQEEKLEDFEYFYTILEENYPYFGIDEKYLGKSFLNSKEEYLSKISESQDDLGYLKALQEITGDLGPEVQFLSKTDYDSQLKYENLPSQKYWMDVLNQDLVQNRYSSLPIEQTLPESNELMMTTPIEGEIAYIKIENFDPLNVESQGQSLKEFYSRLEGYHSLIIDIRDNQGVSVEYFVKNILLPLSQDYYKATFNILQKNKDYTRYLDTFASSQFQLNKEEVKVQDIIEEYQLSSDLKDQFSELSQYSIRIEPNRDNVFTGDLYILQNTNTKYAADTLSQFANRTGFATTVGSSTGGGGVNISHIYLPLPNSGFVFTLPVGMGLNGDGKVNYDYGSPPNLNYGESEDLLNRLIKVIQS